MVGTLRFAHPAGALNFAFSSWRGANGVARMRADDRLPNEAIQFFAGARYDGDYEMAAFRSRSAPVILNPS
jgi:hypothetical protein